MNSLQLKYILSHNKVTKKTFKNVIAYDELDKIKLHPKKFSSYIVNSANKSTKGIHWIIIFGSSQVCEFFDPLGFNLTKFYRDLYKKLKKITNKISYRNIRFQSFQSQSCGAFCCIYLYLRGLGLSQKNIFHNYFDSKSPEYNEYIVSLFIKGKHILEVK